MVDLMCLQQVYKRREITKIKWISRGTNPADAMTKSKPCLALKLLVDTNKLDLQVIEQVERDQIRFTDQDFALQVRTFFRLGLRRRYRV